MLVSAQMIGMLLGGILWGVLGDRRGRLSVLFGSIILYSLANIANGFVTDVTTYAILRFVAGIGLAGELGAGVTLVSETMKRSNRGYGTTIVAGIGVLGAVVAVIVGKKVSDWRTAYYIGGGLGLALLALRIGVVESALFKGLERRTGVSRGNFFALFSKPKRAGRFLCLILSGVPIWYLVGVLFFFAPEIGESMGLTDPRPTAGDAILYGYTGLAIGDVLSGVASQVLKSRRRALFLFVALAGATVAAFFLFAPRSLDTFRVMCLVVGIGGGYWAIFVTMASEQFGTNLRATATTTAPNFVRGTTALMTPAFNAIRKGSDARFAAGVLGVVTISIAFASIFALEETFGRDLDFVEE